LRGKKTERQTRLISYTLSAESKPPFVTSMPLRTTPSPLLPGALEALLLAVVILVPCPAVAGDDKVSNSAAATSEPRIVNDLTASTVRATAITLDWEPLDPSGSIVAGYNVYRRQEGRQYPFQPNGFTGVRDEDGGTRYVADRLEPGKTYFFRVVARDQDLNEVGTPQEIKVTTKEEQDGTYRYMTLKVAVVVYKNANHRNGGDHRTPDRVVEDYKFFLDKAKDFLWRNTNMKLNVDYTYYPIEEYVEMEDRSFQSVGVTARHLQDMFGVMNTQYDMIFRLSPSVGGYWSVGATDRVEEVMDGPDRRTGFSQLRLPLFERGYADDPYETQDQVSKQLNGLIWLFVHEGQHAFDGIYRWNAEPQFGHGDRPEQYGNPEDYPQTGGPESIRHGRRYDFQAKLFRTFDPEDFNVYLSLDDDWGVVREVKDADGDGLPDEDPRVAVNEQTFNSDPTRADTDGDGLDDKAEATDGIYPYSASDPNSQDTDGDGTRDGADDQPRYDVSPEIMKAGRFRPTVDGDVEEWPEKASISRGVSHKTEAVSSFDPTVYGAHTQDSLYIALELPRTAAPLLRFDFDADGRWFGVGNTEVVPDVVNEGLERLRTYDAGISGRSVEDDGVWDTNSDYQEDFGRVYTLNSNAGARIRFDVQRRGGQIGIEMAFPQKPDDKITFESGEEIGFRLDYSGIGGGDETLTRALEQTLASTSRGALKADLGRPGLEYDALRAPDDVDRGKASSNDTPRKAETFDKWSYVYFTLGDQKIEEGGRAEETALKSVYPNPFTGAGLVTIDYSMAERGDVEIAVYDMLGRKVNTLKSGEERQGRFLRVKWDGRAGGEPVASGLYFVRMETPSGTTHTSRLIITR